MKYADNVCATLITHACMNTRVHHGHGVLHLHWWTFKSSFSLGRKFTSMCAYACTPVQKDDRYPRIFVHACYFWFYAYAWRFLIQDVAKHDGTNLHRNGHNSYMHAYMHAKLVCECTSMGKYNNMRNILQLTHMHRNQVPDVSRAPRNKFGSVVAVSIHACVCVRVRVRVRARLWHMHVYMCTYILYIHMHTCTHTHNYTAYSYTAPASYRS